jgi:hypothetical protein
MRGDFLLLKDWKGYCCVDIQHFLCVFAQWWTFRLIPYLGYWECVTSMGVQISLWHTDYISFGYILSSGIAISFGNSFFKIFWTTSRVFHNLHSHQQCTSVYTFIYTLTVAVLYFFGNNFSNKGEGIFPCDAKLQANLNETRLQIQLPRSRHLAWPLTVPGGLPQISKWADWYRTFPAEVSLWRLE